MILTYEKTDDQQSLNLKNYDTGHKVVSGEVASTTYYGRKLINFCDRGLEIVIASVWNRKMILRRYGATWSLDGL